MDTKRLIMWSSSILSSGLYYLSFFFDNHRTVVNIMGICSTIFLITSIIFYIANTYKKVFNWPIIIIFICMLFLNGYTTVQTATHIDQILIITALPTSVILITTAVLLSKSYENYTDKIFFIFIKSLFLFILIGQSVLYCNYALSSTKSLETECTITQLIYESPSDSILGRSAPLNDYSVEFNSETDIDISIISINKSHDVKIGDKVKIKYNKGLYRPIYRVIY